MIVTVQCEIIVLNIILNLVKGNRRAIFFSGAASRFEKIYNKQSFFRVSLIRTHTYLRIPRETGVRLPWLAIQIQVYLPHKPRDTSIHSQVLCRYKRRLDSMTMEACKPVIIFIKNTTGRELTRAVSGVGGIHGTLLHGNKPFRIATHLNTDILASLLWSSPPHRPFPTPIGTLRSCVGFYSRVFHDRHSPSRPP